MREPPYSPPAEGVTLVIYAVSDFETRRRLCVFEDMPFEKLGTTSVGCHVAAMPCARGFAKVATIFVDGVPKDDMTVGTRPSYQLQLGNCEIELDTHIDLRMTLKLSPYDTALMDALTRSSRKAASDLATKDASDRAAAQVIFDKLVPFTPPKLPRAEFSRNVWFWAFLGSACVVAIVAGTIAATLHWVVTLH